MKITIHHLCLICGTAAALLAGVPAGAQSVPERAPAEILATRVDSIFSDLDRDDSPGCAVGVYRAGEVLLAKGYGMASLEHGVPMSPHSVLNVGSVAKQFTGLAVVMLAQRGELSLDDPVRHHLPELPDYTAPVTIRHLIHHTNGIRDYFALMRLARGKVEEAGEDLVLSILDRQEGLNFHPGEHWMYNTGGYVLLAMIVERVTGESFHEFTEREIFGPLGMDDTSFLRAVTTRNRALAYEPYGEGAHRLHIPTHSLVGTTGLYTTIEDLAKWDRNFYDMEVGGRDAIALVQTPGRLNSGQETAYAFGLRLGRYRGLRTVWHSGYDPGYEAMLLRFPDQRLSVALLCNIANLWFRAYPVADLYLADQFPVDTVGSDRVETEVVQVSEEDLKALSGIYQSGDGLVVQRFAVEDGVLVVTIERARFPLMPVGERRFGDGLTHVGTFSEPSAGDSMTVTWSPNPTPRSREPLRLYRIGRHWEPALADLRSYVGTFYSEALDASWQIVERDGELLLRRWGVADQPLESLLPETFVFRGSTAPRLGFERDAAGRVSAMSLSTNQIMGVEFVRRD